MDQIVDPVNPMIRQVLNLSAELDHVVVGCDCNIELSGEVGISCGVLKEVIKHLFQALFITANKNFTVRRVDPDIQIRVCLSMPFYCLLYTSPSPRDRTRSRMPSSA